MYSKDGAATDVDKEGHRGGGIGLVEQGRVSTMLFSRKSRADRSVNDIEDSMAEDDDPSSGEIKAAIAFVRGGIHMEDARR